MTVVAALLKYLLDIFFVCWLYAQVKACGFAVPALLKLGGLRKRIRYFHNKGESVEGRFVQWISVFYKIYFRCFTCQELDVSYWSQD